MKLYEYDEIIDTLYKAEQSENGIDEETGMVFDLTLLDQLEMERDKKIEMALLYYQELTNKAEKLKDYAERTKARQKATENNAESIKRWVAFYLKDQGKNKFETVKVRASFIITERDKTVVTDKKLLPDEFKNYRQTWTENAKAIKEAIKNGVDVPGAHLEDSVRMSIK